MALEGWGVRRVERKEAMRLVIENHYLHRKAPCSVAFGLFDPDENLWGVVMYGMPASPWPRRGIAGRENESIVGELTRLWIADGSPKNSESYLIGKSIKHSGYEIVLSFAEIQAGHRGVVYQATNWLYTGLSDRHVEWVIDGEAGAHSRHMFDRYGGVNGAKEALGDRMVRGERPRKHRYVYVNAKGSRRKQLISQIRYPILPYPKGVE